MFLFFYYAVDNLEPSYNIRLFAICFICGGNPGAFGVMLGKITSASFLCIIHSPDRLPLVVDQSLVLVVKYLIIGFQIYAVRDRETAYSIETHLFYLHHCSRAIPRPCPVSF